MKHAEYENHKFRIERYTKVTTATLPPPTACSQRRSTGTIRLHLYAAVAVAACQYLL
jgi:hypothetical protein